MVLKKLKKSNLKGRGGAGFPVSLKWEMVKKNKASKKYIICNASEGEPGVFKDGFILENYPGELIKGIKIALEVMGNSSAYIYLRKDYCQKFRRKLNKLIGNLPIILSKKTGGYLCGEETTLLESIEGKREEPRAKPPYPPQSGLWEKPTLINNVETFYYVAQVARNNYKFTRFYSISGNIKNPGVYELPEKWTILRILKETDNWPRSKFFVQAGNGITGEILTLKELNQQVTGTGAIIIYNFKKTNPLSLMKKWANFFLDENCGKCVPCREGVYRINKTLNKKEIDKKLLKDLLFTLKETSFCPLGKSIATPFLSLIGKIYKV
jgi:NADH:ubiquinone oxidoreductase subunit F (NADH-binding)